MPSYKTFSQTTAADAQNNANADIMQGDWVKKSDILYESVVVYDCRIWPSNFAKEGENKDTAAFQLRFEKDVDMADMTEEDVDLLPFMLCSFDSARVVNMAHALLKAKDAAQTEDDSPFPFVAVLIEDTNATYVREHFGQYPIVFADPTPENLQRPVPAPKQTTPTTRRGPVSQPRSATSTRR